MEKSSHVFKVCRYSEGQIQESFLIEQKQFLIGRNTEAEVPTTDLSISRRHLVVTLENGQILLEDQKTPGGTRVAGGILAPHRPVPYRPGTEIMLGKSGDTFTIDIFRNHLTDEQLSSEVAREAVHEAELLVQEAKSNFEKTLERAKVEADEVLAHARLEAAEIQKKAHFELLKIQQSAAQEQSKLLGEVQSEVEAQRRKLSDQLAKERADLSSQAKRDAEEEFKKVLDQRTTDWESQKARELESLKSKLQEDLEQRVSAEFKTLKETHAAEITKTEDQIKLLKEEAGRLSAESERHLKELAQQQADSARLKEQVSSAQKASTELQEKIHKEQEIYDKIHQQSVEAQKTLSAFEKELKKSEEARKSVEKLGKKREELSSAVAELEKLHSEKKALIESLTKETDRHKKDAAAELKKEHKELLQRMDIEAKEHRAKLSELLEQEKSQIESQLQELKAKRFESLERELEKEQKRFKKTLPKKVRAVLKVTLKSMKKAWAATDDFGEAKKDLEERLKTTLESLFLEDEHVLVEETEAEVDTALIEMESMSEPIPPETLEPSPENLVSLVKDQAEEGQSKTSEAPADKEVSDESTLSDETPLSEGKWKRRLAMGLLLASLMGTAYLLRENIRAFGTTESSSSESELGPADEVPSFEELSGDDLSK